MIDEVAKINSLDEFKDNKVPAVIFTDVIDTGNIGMIEPRCTLCLILESL